MLVDSEFCVRLCETLLHSLWQAVAIAIVAFAVGRLMRRRPARARYGVFVLALAAAAVLPAVTFVWLGGRRAPAPVAAARAPAAALEVAVPASGAVIQESPANMAPKPSAKAAAARREFNLRDYSAWFAAAYAAGVAAMIAHLLFALRGGVRLRRKSRLITEPALIVSLTRAAESIGAKFMPALAWCERVGAPTVVGVIRPAILIPLSLANGLSTEQVELLLMHELAHLRRHDHWVNLAQRVVEALYFFNPAVWIISRRIRVERELACDDMVLGAGARQAAYADSLLRIAELTRGRAVSALALGATGSPLGRRILRIVGHPSHEQVRMNRVWPIATALALLVALGVFSRGGKVWADDAKKDYSLQEILSGIAAHEARIHSAEFDLTMQFLASNDFPSVPAKPVVEHHVVWDSNFNVTVTGKVIGYDLRNLSADAKYDTWTENRSWDHKRVISTRSDKKEGYISAGSEIFGNFYSPTTPMGAMGYWSVSNGPELTLGGTLAKYGAAFATPKKEIVDGRETYVIETTFPNSPDDPAAPKDLTKRFYICPELQFSPVKIVFLFKGVLQGEWAVQYKTIDGIAFPTECRETRWYPAGDRKGREISPPSRIEYSNIKLDQSTPRAIEIPAGYTTIDFTKRDFQKESEPGRIRVETQAREAVHDATTTGSLVWGKEVGGLRAAVELTPKKTEYADGDKLKVRFHVQNVSRHAIQLASAEFRTNDYAIVSVTSNVEPISITQNRYTGDPKIVRRTLRPGETTTFDATAIGIGKAGDVKAGGPLVGPVLDAPSGSYFVSYAMEFPDVKRTSARAPNESVPQPGDWQGKLVTGQVPITIKTYLRAERSNKPGEKLIFHGIDLTTAPLASQAQLGSVLRSKDVVVPYDSLQGRVYYAPSKSLFYIQHDLMGSSERTYYGPFDGDPTAAMDGVAVTLRADKDVWGEGSELTFKIDLHTARKRVLPHYGPPLDDFLVDLDGKLYRSAKPEFFHGLRSVFPSPATERKGLVFRLRPQDWVRDDATSAPMALAPGKHRVRVRLSLKDNYREDAISNEVVIGINSRSESSSPDAGAREREIYQWFQRFARGERDTSQTLPTKMGMHGLTRDDLAWSDIPILLELAQDSTRISLEHATLPSSMASSYAQRQGRAGTVALWLIELIRLREASAKRPWPLNPICVKGDLKFSECEASEPIRQEALAAYREWWSQAQSMLSAEAAKIDPLAWTDLNWFGAQSGPRVISGWGKPDGGVQVRLAAERGYLNGGEFPTLFAKVRNTGEHQYQLTPSAVFFWVEYDGQWYRVPKIAYTGPALSDFSKNDLPRTISFKLSSDYQNVGAPLKLAGGRHTIRIAVPMEPSPKDPSSTQIRPVSDPVSIEWMGNTEPFSGQVQSSGDPAELAKLDSLTWGETVAGIQCAVRPLKTEYKVGEKIEFDLLYRNVSNRDITVCVYPDPFSVWALYEFRSIEGYETFYSMHSLGFHLSNLELNPFVRIKPGESTGQHFVSTAHPDHPGTYILRASLNKINRMDQHMPSFEEYCRKYNVKPWIGVIESGPAFINISANPK